MCVRSVSKCNANDMRSVACALRSLLNQKKRQCYKIVKLIHAAWWHKRHAQNILYNHIHTLTRTRTIIVSFIWLYFGSITSQPWMYIFHNFDFVSLENTLKGYSYECVCVRAVLICIHVSIFLILSSPVFTIYFGFAEELPFHRQRRRRRRSSKMQV